LTPTQTEILILGGGLAGLTAGIHLSRQGKDVIILEKHPYPRHKVCGEYLSAEVVPYLQSIGLDLREINPKNITRFCFSTFSGKTIEVSLPLGGLGISRFALDHFLYLKAVDTGCKVIFAEADQVHFDREIFTVNTRCGLEFKAKVVLGAYGRKSVLDRRLGRNPAREPNIAIKVHCALPFAEDSVGLYHFKSGYCGVSQVESGHVNVCLLAEASAFKGYSPKSFLDHIGTQNPALGALLANSQMQFDPLAISQVSFTSRNPVQNHVLLLGDCAAQIHPLCGNGMAMAVHSARLASVTVLDFLNHKHDRIQMERRYRNARKAEFSVRLFAGRILTRILEKPYLQQAVFRMVAIFPGMLHPIIKLTHGKPK
jgi:menaquinone-9 beta-reductase